MDPFLLSPMCQIYTIQEWERRSSGEGVRSVLVLVPFSVLGLSEGNNVEPCYHYVTMLVFPRVSWAGLCTIFSSNGYVYRKSVGSLGDLLTQNLYLFENNAAFAITKCSSLCNISTRAFNYYFKNYRFLSTPNYRAITHPCLSDWLIWVIVLTKAELIWQFYKAKLSKTASNVELLNSKLWFAHAEIINTCTQCSSMHDHLTHENKLVRFVPSRN